MRWPWSKPEPPVVEADGAIKNPSNESIDLIVKFHPDGRIRRTRLYDTLAATWGEDQPSFEQAVYELRRRARTRPAQRWASLFGRWRPPAVPSMTVDGMVAMRLVPVEVFGTDSCCEHGLHGDNDSDECKARGHGLMDAVSAWSDCNRAEGHIYRVDEPESTRLPGESVTIYVAPDDVAFFERRFGDGAT